MRKIVALVLLVLVGLTGCAPTVPVQPIITYTPANTTTPAPVITLSDNPITIIPANATTNPTRPPGPNISANSIGNPWPNVEVFTNLFTNQNPSVNATVGQEFVIPYSQFTSSNITFQPANVVVVESKQFVQNPGALIPDGTTWILFKAVALGSTKVSVTETTRFGDPLQTKTLTINIFPTEVNASAATAIYIHVSPPGSGSVSPSTGNYTYGTNVTFIATPAEGYVFSNWWYEYSDSGGTRGGKLGGNITLNLAIERSASVTAYFVALPTNWNNAVSLGQVHRPIAVGEYFYISQDYIGGQFGPDSVNATFDESLVALIDRKDAGSVGPLTPGMHSAAVWLLFKALRPGIANISVTQIRNNYSDPPKTYSVTIGN